MTSSTEVVAYTYNAENWTPAGVVEVGIREGWLAPAARDMVTEEVLDQAQHQFGIDRYDEGTFDSGIFPKVIFQTDINPDELFRNEHGEYVHIN
ncbi:hypothetical protein SEA_ALUMINUMJESUS_95 [Microbacterium phage AluminumJesus]|nr:hypothetical protein SEA_BLAB_95 [Microbacterium phage Blab]UJD20830.1 hypothetical protein SEA_ALUMINUMJESUS_95 [Microbacterium phage AluminumJesus]UVG34466.1 hypothetical protein SEA_GAZEBO_97 [Microbacterium phage Gazebo]